MTMSKIIVAKEFSKHPAGRYQSDGPYSGEQFREKYLFKPLAKNEQVIVDLDGARGYGSSFLEEAFGGLVRRGIPAEKVLEYLKIISRNPALAAEIKKLIIDAGKRAAKVSNGKQSA